MGGSRPGSRPKVSDARRILEWLTTTTFEVRPDRRSFSLQLDPAARASRPLRTTLNLAKLRRMSSMTMKSPPLFRPSLRGSRLARSRSSGLPYNRNPSPSPRPRLSQPPRQSPNPNQSRNRRKNRNQRRNRNWRHRVSPTSLLRPSRRPRQLLRRPPRFRRARRIGPLRCSASLPPKRRPSRSSHPRIPLHRARHPSPRPTDRSHPLVRRHRLHHHRRSSALRTRRSPRRWQHPRRNQPRPRWQTQKRYAHCIRLRPHRLCLPRTRPRRQDTRHRHPRLRMQRPSRRARPGTSGPVAGHFPTKAPRRVR